ncbi:MAG: thrombospondin type 3 repeat-containing protein, partial [Akkermansiaceae bacterium]|nr:thrombospondin type 3 repeat-containing protein [Akkermansiaceae bacterium]
PLDNTPPFGLERLLQIVTTQPAYGSQPTGYGIDRVHLYGGDLQTPAGHSLEILTPTTSFDTTTVPGTAIYTAASFYEARISDDGIAAGTSYDTLSYRWFDGTHYSPVIKVRLIGFWKDTTPADGLPDSWMLANFGTTTPGNAGSPSHPESDPDGDGLVNRVELYLQTDPNNPASGPARLMIGSLPDRRLDWSAVRFAPYVVESSPDLANWTTRRCASDYAGTGVLSRHLPEDAAFSRMFYRLKMEP